MKHIARTLLLLVVCATGVWGQKAATTVKVKNEAAVNTPGLDFSPTFFEDGIVFISTNSAGLEKITDENLQLNAMSILRSRRDAEGALGVPEPFSKEITSRYHEGPVCFGPTGDVVYFSRNIVIDGKDKLAADGVQKMRLYTANKSGETWADPVDLKFNNGEFDDCHPSISIDGDKLYFSSNRPGGFGGMDLYVAFRVGEGWSEPTNLGDAVNSAGNEVFPFIHADNTLYFASDAREGAGGLDIFQTKMDSDKWSKPVALPKPFNTSGDDFGLIVDLNKINGYFSSNGAGGQGQDEIFSFSTENGNLDEFVRQEKPLSEGNYDLIVTVTDKATGSALSSADVRILSMDMGDVIGRDETGNLITVQTVDGQDILKSIPPHAGLSGTSDKKGRYATTLRPGNYSITVAQEGYQTRQLNVQIEGSNNRIAVPLDKVSDKVLWNASVFNYITNSPLAGATAVVINKPNGKRDTIVTDDNGRIQYYLEPNTKYSVELYQGGRLIGATDVESGTPGGKPLSQNISVAPLLPGSVVELPNIYYNYNDASLRPDARKDLDIVVSLMKQHPGLTVELASHTDARGTASYNQSLSQRRANGVVEYLVTKGVSRNRLMPVGYGESRPRNGCSEGVTCPETDHARNRRTEIKMITGVQGSSLIYVDGKPANSTNNPDPEPVTSTQRVDPTPVKHTGGHTGGSTMSVSTGDMEFYVIAGSFLMENRAENQLATLQGAGYGEAQILRFEGSTYFSVCAQRFSSRRAAEELERQLEKRDKIDAYVRAVPK
jgi:outer membrane protein OmpA-like peptidoglycan-associated protein